LYWPSHGFAAEEKDLGWKPLFNGRNLDGWYIYLGKGPRNVDTNGLVQIEDGMLHMYRGKADGSQQLFGYIATERFYSNYVLRFEYKWGTNRFGARAKSKRDAGVIYHMFGEDSVWPSGVECQVQEGDVGDVYTVNTRVTTTVDVKTTNVTALLTTNANTGAIQTNYGVRPVFLTVPDGGVPFVQGVSNGIRRVIRSSMSEHDGWNKVEINVCGSYATHCVNGRLVNLPGKMQKIVNGGWVPLAAGKIIFQLEGAEVFYRNIEIQDRKSQPTPEAVEK
jgi:hypothetical protein